MTRPETSDYPEIMPECADFFLSQINEGDYQESHEIPILFREYFTHHEHIFYCGLPGTGLKENRNAELDLVFKNMCKENGFNPCPPPCPSYSALSSSKTNSGTSKQDVKSSDQKILAVSSDTIGCCIPCSCLTLCGDRRIKQRLGFPTPTTLGRIVRLFPGDTLWLFYFERMGIFKILGAILDDYAFNGKYPIASNNITALILEMMIRHIKKGESSIVRDRATTYARMLGWQLKNGLNLDMNKIQANKAFTQLFHRFMILALAFYKDKRLAEAIQGTTNVQPPSVTTKIAIQDTISLLKNSMEPFFHGRNYYNTLNGIVWVIATIDVIYRLRDSIGIPLSYERLDQIIPAAYNILVEKKSDTTVEPNRYKLHYECAHDGRDILIDIAGNAVNFTNTDELGTWLNIVEDRIEGYRVAYLELTGIDLSKNEFRSEGALKIEQQI